MSSFICSDKTMQAVTKVIYYKKYSEGKTYYHNLEHLNELLNAVAGLNCKAYSVRYNEEVEEEFEQFSKLPVEPITPADLKRCYCYLYQCNESDALENSSIFQNVLSSVEHFLKMLNITKKDVMDIKGNWD